MSNSSTTTTSSLSTVMVIKQHLQGLLNNPDTINDALVVESIKDALKRLNEIDMDKDLLGQSQIGFAVRGFKSHANAVVEGAARALLRKWRRVVDAEESSLVVCTGRAAQALQKFRERLRELERDGKPKPDMVAYKELRRAWTPFPRHHGELEGVPIGVKLAGRGEAAILGIHQNILSGIDAVKDEACYAVCLSGGYADDHDNGTDDGTVIYTGSGGQKGKHQVSDQVENAANLSLITSVDTADPIRLLRRTENGKVGFYYEGLYRCTDYTYEESVEGPKVYKFTLVPIPGKSRHSTTVQDAGVKVSGTSSSRKRIASKMLMKQEREERKPRR
mmetsp:Transcript_5571/g.11767  ORF Transcript_5571/g.11767 Transcript_5571/m.11767 type:complete len:333 (-) Transcript_5571:160-1158(-)